MNASDIPLFRRRLPPLAGPSGVLWTPRLLDGVRWNLIKRGRVLDRADAVIISVPKCGRTWLKVFLKSYFSAVEGTNFSLKARGSKDEGTPDVRFSHDLWEHLVRANVKQRLVGKHLLPAPLRRTQKVILMGREPKDVMVSLFFHLTKRARLFRGNLSDMIRHEKFGIRPVTWIWNTWMEELAERDGFMLLRYEDLHSDTENQFTRVLSFLGFEDIREEALHEALQASDFTAMRKMEATGSADHHSLRPADPNDPESFKVRKGKVGGYREYLSEEDIRYIDEVCELLDIRYGYR